MAEQPCAQRRAKKGARRPKAVFAKVFSESRRKSLRQSGERLVWFVLGNGDRNGLQRVPFRRPGKRQLILIPEKQHLVFQFQNGLSTISAEFVHSWLLLTASFSFSSPLLCASSWWLSGGRTTRWNHVLFPQHNPSLLGLRLAQTSCVRGELVKRFSRAEIYAVAAKLLAWFSSPLSKGHESTTQRPLTNRDVRAWMSVPIFLLKQLTAEKQTWPAYHRVRLWVCVTPV